MTIEEVNKLSRNDFVKRFSSLFEGSPWIAGEAWHARPFRSVEQLHEALCEVMYNAPLDKKLELIRAHPDLVGNAAMAGTLMPESSREQASAGLDELSPEEIARFNHLNRAYKDRFGFPFVICARENKKESILAGFDSRLHNTREEEIETALGEIAKIAQLRLLDIVE